MISWRDYKSNFIPENAKEYIDYFKDKGLSEKEYLAAFLGTLHSIMINYGTEDILILGYSPLLAEISVLSEKYASPELTNWLLEVSYNYKQIKDEFDEFVLNNDREGIRGTWNWLKECDKKYFKLVPQQ